MNWYYAKNGAQHGPVPLETLLDKISMGEVAPTDLAWREGLADWAPVSAIAELKPKAAALETTAVGNPPGQAPPPSPYAPPHSQIVPAGGIDQQIPTYLWQSIVVTLLCCWPFGIPAIVNAAKVDGLKGRGDLAGARDASDRAKKWCLISFSLGLLVLLAYAVLMAIGWFSQSSPLPGPNP